VPAALAVFAAAASPAGAQIKSPAERIEDLEARVKDLEKKLEDVEKAQPAPDTKAADEDPDFFSGGVITIGGAKLQFGGEAEFLFIDTESESDPIVGDTEAPDPHFKVNRLRLEPRIILNREISLHSQIDFRPEEGDVVLKEMTARHATDPEWWFGSRARIGLDDRFIRPTRRTKTYPLIGTAFWRDESLFFQWKLRFGDKDGEPIQVIEEVARPEDVPAEVASPQDDAVEAPKDVASGDGGREEEKEEKKDKKKEKGKGKGKKKKAKDGGGGGSPASAGVPEGADAISAGEPRPGPAPITTVPQAHGAFDFVRNWGEIGLHFSIGDGYTLNNRRIGFDGADFNDIVQDDRTVIGDLSVREIGVGLEYVRNFRRFGELGLLVFYYNDELNDESIQFLQQDLTVRDPVTGAPTGGYGDSNTTTVGRFGVGIDYFLAAEQIFDDPALRANDGLRLAAQWIEGHDGKFDRSGWYVQGSYRWSFPQRLLFDRYFRSIEPLVRYGTYRTNIDPLPTLPGTWDREQLLFGAIIEVTGEIFFKVEYAINYEDTGASATVAGPDDVDNNELMVELLLQF
jgi:hypothetical protein